MKKINILILAVVSLIFFSCKKNSKDLDVDYNYPFGVNIEFESTLLLNKEYLLNINLTNESKIQNPNNEYYLSYSGDSFIIKDDKDKILTPNSDVKITYENITKLKLTSQQIGQKTVVFTIKNAQGYTINKSVTFNTISSTLNVTNSETILNSYVNTDVEFKFTVSQEVQSPLSLVFENLNNTAIVKLNDMEVSKDAKLNLENKKEYSIKLNFKEVGNFNPKLIISDEKSSYPIELSVSIKPRELNFSNLNLKYRTSANQNIYFDVNNTLLYNSNNIYSFNANIETVSKTLKVFIKSNLDMIKEIHYKGSIYRYGDIIEISNPNDFSLINLFFNDKAFGEVLLEVQIEDEFGTKSGFLTKPFIYYNSVKVNNLIEDKILSQFVNQTNFFNGDYLNSSSNFNSLGNPITSIEYVIEGNLKMYGSNKFFNAPFSKKAIVQVNNEKYTLKFIHKYENFTDPNNSLGSIGGVEYSKIYYLVKTMYADPVTIIIK